MNLGELVAAFYGRGYRYLSRQEPNDAIARRLLNRSYHALCEKHEWSWLEVTTTGPAPLSVPSARFVRTVVNTESGVPLEHRDREWIVRQVSADLTDTGSPVYWYLEGGSVKTYPVSAVNLEAVSVQVPTDLSDDEDEPLVPERYHELILDGAVFRALREANNHAEAAAAKAAYDEEVDDAIWVDTGQADEPDYIVKTEYD